MSNEVWYTLSIDGNDVSVPEELATLLDACRAQGVDDADALLSGELDAGQRVSRLRRRTGGRAYARSGLLALGGAWK